VLIPAVHRFRKSLALAALVTLGLSGPALAARAEGAPAAGVQQAVVEPFTACVPQWVLRV
jgi:hypothetical protein